MDKCIHSTPPLSLPFCGQTLHDLQGQASGFVQLGAATDLGRLLQLSVTCEHYPTQEDLQHQMKQQIYHTLILIQRSQKTLSTFRTLQ